MNGKSKTSVMSINPNVGVRVGIDMSKWARQPHWRSSLEIPNAWQLHDRIPHGPRPHFFLLPANSPTPSSLPLSPIFGQLRYPIHRPFSPSPSLFPNINLQDYIDSLLTARPAFLPSLPPSQTSSASLPLFERDPRCRAPPPPSQLALACQQS